MGEGGRYHCAIYDVTMDQVKYELAAQDDHPHKERLDRIKNVLSTIALLLVSGTISSVLGYFFYHLDTPGGTVVLINLRIRFLPNRHLEWRDIKGRTLLQGYLGTTFPQRVHHDIQNKNASFMKIHWSNQADLLTDWWKIQGGIQCYHFSWGSPTCIHSVLQDCYLLDGARWYGGGTYQDQKWNIEGLDIPMTPYLTGDAKYNKFGKILGRYWLSSNGIAIYIDPGSPLWVGINEAQGQKLCFRAAYDRCPYWQADARTPIHLNYTMCAGPNMTSVHRYMVQTIFPYPKGPPSHKTLQFITNPPSFLTPSSPQSYIKASHIIRDSYDILQNRPNNSFSKVIIKLGNIAYSDHLDNSTKNSSTTPQSLVNHLQKLGYEVLLAISPSEFINRTIRTHWNTYKAILHASDPNYGPPSVRWETTANRLWKIIGDWFSKRVLQWKRQFRVSSFVFQEGHALSLPFHDVLIKGLHIPDTFTSVYQSLAIDMDSGALFEAASRGSNLSSFLMMRDRDWSWGSDNGLRSIIPEAMTLSLTGCSLLMAPGLSFHNLSSHNDTIREELEDIYLHWMQTVAFLPSFRFTTQPFFFGENVTDTVKDILALRRRYINEFVQLARNQHKKLLPIIRPIWWLAPTDVSAQTIDDQFLIGNQLMVAPMLERRMWKRSIYLPRGVWYDVLQNHTLLKGPLWLHDYATTPSQIPLFARNKPSNHEEQILQG